jgi:hypothetical protein
MSQKIKILRLGMTEGTLLYIYWLNKYQKIINVKLLNDKNSMIKWLYTTSGFYDKKIEGNYFNVVQLKDTNVYTKYMESILDSLKNADILSFQHHDIGNPFNKLMPKFFSILSPQKKEYITQEILFDFMKNKNILVISPFASLFKSQIENGNCKKIYPYMPDIGKISIYHNIYTFFNDGPDNNILETVEKLVADIKKIDNDQYDSAIISCGAYSNLIAKELYDIDKNVLTIGADLQPYLGVSNSRVKEYHEKNNIQINRPECWIREIPDDYKPKNYKKIENGCYW